MLRAKGYRVLARHFRHPLGEVDLIVRRGRLMIFILAKFRADRDAGPCAVSLVQWRRISAGTSGFVLRHLQYVGLVWRFEIFVVGGYGRFRTIKISCALEPARNFGESVGREARSARRALVERDADGLTRWSANGSDCRY